MLKKKQVRSGTGFRYLFIHIYIYIYISIKKLKWLNNGNGSGSNQNVLLQYNVGALLSGDKLWVNSWWMFYFTVWSITSIVPSTPTTTWERFYSSYSHLQPGRDVVQINEQVGWSTKLDEGNTYNKHMRLHWEIPVRLSFCFFVCFLRTGLSQLRRLQCHVSHVMRPPPEKGFTAVILTYNRVEMLFKLLSKLDEVPSLTKVIHIISTWDCTEKFQYGCLFVCLSVS